jgi:hypothetical protein
MMRRVALAAALAIAVGACAPPAAPTLPTGTGTPLPDFLAAYDQATATCAPIKTITAVLGLSGRVGSNKLRGRIEAGFAAPAKMRLEGLAPFGKPVFVLTAVADKGTLVLPRDERVLADAPPADIVNALAGVALDADAMRTAVTGCGFWTAARPSDAKSFPGGWAALTFPDGTAYLRSVNGSWQYAAALRDTLSVFYGEYAGGRPGLVRLRAGRNGPLAADLTLRVSQVEINVSLDDAAFAAEPLAHGVPLTLDELRRAGPLGGAIPNP